MSLESQVAIRVPVQNHVTKWTGHPRGAHTLREDNGRPRMVRKGVAVPIQMASVCWSANLESGVPGGSDGKESACNAGDPGLIPGSRRCPGEGSGNPLQYSCLENSMDREDW